MQTAVIFGSVYDSDASDYAGNVTVVVSGLSADNSPVPMKPTKCDMEEPGVFSSDEYDAAYGVCVANEEREVNAFQFKTDSLGFYYKVFRFESTRFGTALDAAEKEKLNLQVKAIDSSGTTVRMSKTTAKLYLVTDWVSTGSSILPTVKKLGGGTERLEPSVSVPKGKFFDDMKAYFMSQVKPSNEYHGFAGCGYVRL